jgi:hypothetical protein
MIKFKFQKTNNTIIYLSFIMIFISSIFKEFEFLAILIFYTSLILSISKPVFYFHLPILIFFSQKVNVIAGFNIFDLFFIIFLIKMIFSKIYYKFIFIPALFIIITYSLTVVININFYTTITIVSTSLMIFIFLSNFNYDKFLLKKFISFFLFSTILSGLYGFLVNNPIDSVFIFNGLRAITNRNIGTFVDPNHFGFFLNIAIFLQVSMMIEKKSFFNFLLLIFFYFLLVTTLSITALLTNCFGLVLFFILKKNKFRVKIIQSLSFLFFMSVFVFLALRLNIESVQNLILRVQVLIAETDDLVLITSNRSIIWENNVNFFLNQNMVKILFGGNYISDYGRDIVFSTVSHQAILDMLLNFGIIGSGILLITFILNFIKIYNLYKNDPFDSIYLGILMTKIIWILYSFGLSMFPAWNFQIFFFI